MTNHAELIDLDFYCDLLDESEEVELIQQGELNLHRIIHPRRGFLTAIQGGRFVLLVQGDFRDNRGLPASAAVLPLGLSLEATPEAPERLPGVIVPFPGTNRSSGSESTLCL